MRWLWSLVVTVCGVPGLIASGCGGDGVSSPQLFDGSAPPQVPTALANVGGVLPTRVRSVPRDDVEPSRLRACERGAGRAGPGRFVERTGVAGGSLTFRDATSVRGCDEVASPASDRGSLSATPWCGLSVGHLRNGRLTDPRLDLCPWRDDDRVTAFAWVDVGPGIRWIAVREGGNRYLYEAVGQVPIRVDVVRRPGEDESAVTLDVEEYAGDGAVVRRRTIEAAVAG